MSTITAKVLSVPATTPAPGARLVSSVLATVMAWLSPLPRQRTRSEEAAEVREMARRLAHDEPGFAADLYAAADRHEAV